MKESLCEKMVEVRWMSEGDGTCVDFKYDDLRQNCGYVPQSGRSLEGKSIFMMSLQMSEICILQMI